MALNGVNSTLPDGRYIKELERTVKDLLERVAKLERDVKSLKNKG